jgi:hypothetical protein
VIEGADALDALEAAARAHNVTLDDSQHSPSSGFTVAVTGSARLGDVLAILHDVGGAGIVLPILDEE